ncbi:potassium channel subfamily K member 18 isoform X2 [Notolabrus celidotus]|uniref:potassium channel subfamily K member 18 isoform X2 n=1 Tax=Notolabrus celidotus TaxID=1203425 RepID=UPI00148F45EB|nr:potassium channel subfamily K member 18 isoform X2 [Notolabrus celidotus]
MSVAIKRGISAKAESRKCAARFWRLFPHLVLCLSLVGYAALGALMFQYIEGGVPSVPQDYSEFLGKIITKVQSLTENASCTHQNIVKEVEGDMKGYGEIYPVTLLGKVVCVLYAMVGIPLMLLVILDVGDFLAMLMTRAYIQIHTFFKDFRSHKWSPRQEERRVDTLSCRTLEDGTFVFSHDVVGLSEPLDIRQVLHSQADIRQKSIQLQNNKEIFEKILAREDLLRKGPLLRTLSCPELARMPHKYRGYTIWDFTGLGDGMETLDVPFILILFIVFAYILFGGLILPLWETEFKGFDPYYFCFITLTTIGFGDIIPNHPKYFLLTSLFIIVGMAIMSMAFKLCQTRLVICYRQCIKFISRGNAETFIKEDSD